MTENKMLSSTLFDLAKQVDSMVIEGKTTKKITITKKPYNKAKISNLKYEKGIARYQTSYEYTEKEELNWISVRDFIDTEIKKLKEYNELIEIISKQYKTSKEQADGWLNRFVYKIVEIPLSKGLSDHDILEYITIFTHELEHNPILFKPIVWIDGIYLGSNSILISDSIKIKKPEPDDLEYEIALDIFPPLAFKLSPFQEKPSAILLLEYRVDGQPKMLDIIQRVINTLRLYRVGSVSTIKTEWISSSILQIGGTTYRNVQIPAHFKYELNEKDEDCLKDFFNVIEPKIPAEIIQKGTGETNFITIAFDRYNDSILKQDIPESRLSSAIMALEALYLKDDEMGELAERLAQRTSLLLSLFGYDSLETFNIIKRSYNIRSRFVHGSKIEKEDMKDIAKLIDKVVDYARKSIVIFLQLQELIEKNQLLNRLTNSLLDNKAKDKLRDFVKDRAKI